MRARIITTHEIEEKKSTTTLTGTRLDVKPRATRRVHSSRPKLASDDSLATPRLTLLSLSCSSATPRAPASSSPLGTSGSHPQARRGPSRLTRGARSPNRSAGQAYFVDLVVRCAARCAPPPEGGASPQAGQRRSFFINTCKKSSQCAHLNPRPPGPRPSAHLVTHPTLCALPHLRKYFPNYLAVSDLAFVCTYSLARSLDEPCLCSLLSLLGTPASHLFIQRKLEPSARLAGKEQKYVEQ